MSHILGIDTGLKHMGWAVIHSERDEVIACGKIDPSPRKNMERVLFFLDELKKISARNPPVELWAMEDYLMSKFNDAYLTAEFLGALKVHLILNHLNYILVHPAKTKKYVVKRRKVEKDEIVAFVKQNFTFKTDTSTFNKKDMEDICDAAIIACVGRLAFQYDRDSTVSLTWEKRWKEIMLTDKSGILTKPGLAHFHG